MKVIEHGNTYKTAFCPHCDAELGYTKKDIYVQDYLDLHPFGGTEERIHRESLTCPECGYKFDLVYTINGKSQLA